MTSPQPRPNILFVLADDLGAWGMGCVGNAEIRTPNLDRLAAEGVRFTRFFCASPVCSPARASLLTGMIPSQHGVHDWLRAGNTPAERPDGRLIPYLQGLTGYTRRLADHGYVCGLSGKWHLGDSHHPQQGYSYWRAHAGGGGPYYGAPMLRDGELYRAPEYVTDVITANAVHFIEQRAGDAAPWHLSVHYTAPHSPWDRANHPAELYDGYLRDCPFASVPDEPMHPWQINSAPLPLDAASRRAVLSGYYAAVTAMDAGIGRLLDSLRAQHLRENTLVVFMSDNGMNMGHHGIYGKGNGTYPQNMYDTSVLVPAIIAQPGAVPGGETCDALLSQYDWMPTVLDYVGIAHPDAERLPGRSFAPLLRGEPAPTSEAVVVYDEYGPVRMIRTRECKYVHRYPDGPHEFYDLMADPEERANLVADGAYGARVRELRGELERWYARYVDAQRDGAHAPVTGKGQLGMMSPRTPDEPLFADDWSHIRPR